MLLRLRQLTAHTFLLQDTIEDLFELEDVERMWDATASEADRESGASGRNILVQMRKMIADKNKPQPDGSNRPSTTPGYVNDDAELEQSQPFLFKFRKYLRDLAASSKWQALTERSLCSKCRDMPHDPVVTDCLHLYCSECIKSMAMEAAAEKEDSAACMECGKIYSEVRLCPGLKELGYDDSLAGSEGGSPKPQQPQQKANKDVK